MSRGMFTTELVLGTVGKGRLAEGSNDLQDPTKSPKLNQKSSTLFTGGKKVRKVIEFESSG